jgi:Glycosyl transferases group 1
VGMVGQFKSQKAYTRAIRVLAQLRDIRPAKLLVLGSWDHDYGSGRIAKSAFDALAAELGVSDCVLTPGNVHPIDPYLGAFDVFLNTSVYEGLSISLLEAIQAGCPVVSADAGGNREILPADGILVEDPSDIPAYVSGVLRMAARQRSEPPATIAGRDLVPRLWVLLAKYAGLSQRMRGVALCGTLIVTETLECSGADTPIIDSIAALPSTPAEVPMISLVATEDWLDQVAHILDLVERLRAATVCFWNVRAEIKLTLAKILVGAEPNLVDLGSSQEKPGRLIALEHFKRRICLTDAAYIARLAPPVLRRSTSAARSTLA